MSTTASPILTLLGFVIILVPPLAFVALLITACIRKKPLWWILTAVSAVVCLLLAVPVLFIGARAWKDGSDRAKAILEARDNGLTEENGKRVECSERRVSLIVPRNWTDITRQLGNEDASLAMGNLFREEYCIVITETRAEIDAAFGDGQTLADFADFVTKNIAGSMDGEAVMTGPSPHPLPNAENTARAEIRGVTDGIDLHYVAYLVETDGNFHQVLFWTLTKNAERAIPIFDAVAPTFAEIAVDPAP